MNEQHLVRVTQRRVTETPNATMTTLASPTASASQGLSVWTIEMRAGQQGPVHVFDVEQVWTLLDGEATLTVGDAVHALSSGDTLTVPPGVERQVTATADAQLLACGASAATVSVPGESEARGTPPWIA